MFKIGLMLARRALVVRTCSLPAPASASQDFYMGKTLTIVVGFTPGGGYDANARLLSRHIGNHIPGRPNVVVQNMPGAAILVNRFFTLIRRRHATAPSSRYSTSA